MGKYDLKELVASNLRLKDALESLLAVRAMLKDAERRAADSQFSRGARRLQLDEALPMDRRGGHEKSDQAVRHRR
jgi:hypothetical protein